MLEATNDGKVDIRHDGSTKLETASGGIDVTGNIVVSGTVDGRDLQTDGTKLDGIEASADVTDATNVTAAGALMDSEVTNLAQVKSFASSDYATAAQGTLATNALPKAGGTITGDLVVNDDFTVDTDTFLVNSGTDNVEINGYLTVNSAPGASGVDINTTVYPNAISMADSAAISLGTAATFQLSGGADILNLAVAATDDRFVIKPVSYTHLTLPTKA